MAYSPNEHDTAGIPSRPATRDESTMVDGLYRRPRLVIGVTLLVVGLVFSLGAAFGYGLGRTTVQAAASVQAQTLPPNADGAAATLQPSFNVFWEAMDHLYRDFYGERPDPHAVTYGAIRGVLTLIDDPNTSFLAPDEAAFFRTNLDGAFEGIGARVGWDEESNTLVITEPFENQPAWNAGIRRGDLILAVDGESLVGSDVTEAVRRIRGPKGTDVVLTVQRPEIEAPFDITITRDRIAIPTIVTERLGENGEIAYVRLNSFSDNSGTLVREAVRNALRHDPVGLIFDLRGNSGGLLREAVRVTNVFVQDEVVLFERFSDGRTETYRATARAATTDLPMVVLVNAGSASASEIVAGALQDVGRAPLVGTTTFGKGSVQLPHTLSDGSIMRVTIARWYTPGDRTIEGEGLTPDLVVEISDAQSEAGSDPQLEAALELLSAPTPARATP
jgi:carboxyl-terminal processing protease